MNTLAETSTGDVIYDEDDRRAEELDSAQRLADTISIHVRLEDGANECRRVVKFLGSSPSSYRIEYLHANPRTIETSDAEFDPDVVLALHQRWALQCLAACRYIHAKGIIINASLGECTWLRSDLSLVIAGLVAASCPELEISPWILANRGRALLAVQGYRFSEDRSFQLGVLDLRAHD